MNRAVLRLGALACALSAAFAFTAPAPAQQKTEKMISTPADHFAISPGGVDMRTGRYAYSETDLSIGGERGLALTRTMVTDAIGHANPFGNFSHNWDIMITERRININLPGESPVDYRMSVHFGGRSQTFEAYSYSIGYAHKSQGVGWASLSFVGDKASAGVIYTFTATDGTVAVFRPLGFGDCSSGYTFRCAYVSEITEPDGTRLTFDYAASGAPGGAVQLRRVISSRGYALLLEGTNNRVTKACVFNLTLAPAPPVGPCPGNDLAIASYVYIDYSGPRLSSVTGPDNAVSSFTYAALPNNHFTMGFVRPGEQAPWLTNTFYLWPDEQDIQQEIVTLQNFADGRIYAYGFEMTPVVDGRTTIAGGGYDDALGNGTSVVYDWPLMHGDTPYYCESPPCEFPPPDDFPTTYQMTPGPVRIIDPLGRTTTFDYCDPVPMAGLPPWETNRCVVIPLQFFVDAEGARTELEYDGHRNITRVTRHPRPGATPVLAPIVTSATYDIANVKSSAKPLTMTDARGNTTEYIYAPQHGGVRTETGPAPAPGAPRPQTRYEYVERHARISNGAGGTVQVSPAVWLLTATSLCRTSAATGNPASPCATAGDEVRTEYDYGPIPDTGPNNLLLRGQTVTSTDIVAGVPVTTTLRTCYRYDPLGRRISETQPAAGLASCP